MFFLAALFIVYSKLFFVCLCLYNICPKQGDPTYDVLVERPSGCFHNKSSTATGQPKDGKKYSESERELTGLTPSEVSPLQPFETDGSLEKSTPSGLAIGELSDFAEGLKDKGNALFKLGDTDAAAKIFASVLRTLARTPAVGTVSTSLCFRYKTKRKESVLFFLWYPSI